MAFNEILVGRLNRYVQKLLMIKNTALRGLAPDLQTILPLFSGTEDRYLQGWFRFGQEFLIAAQGAGNLSTARLRNPSGVVAVIEWVGVDNGAGATGFTMQLSPQTTDLANPGTANNRMDPRGNPTTSMKMSFGSLTAVQSGGATVHAFSATSPSYQFTQEFTLLPGDVFQVIGDGANAALNVSMIWRERVLESSEST